MLVQTENIIMQMTLTVAVNYFFLLFQMEENMAGKEENAGCLNIF